MSTRGWIVAILIAILIVALLVLARGQEITRGQSGVDVRRHEVTAA